MFFNYKNQNGGVLKVDFRPSPSLLFNNNQSAYTTEF